MKIECQHIAANCNPMPNVLEFVTSDIIAYCFKNQVGIYSLKTNNVYMNLHCDRSITPNRANCIKTFKQQKNWYIVVGYDSGHIVTFESSDLLDWKIVQTLKQKSSIQSLTYFNRYLAVNNSDSLVSVYYFNSKLQNSLFQPIQEIQFPLNKLVETTALQIIKNNLVLFIGGVDQKIHCYTKSLEKLQEKANFQFKFSLSGHQNAITKLVIVQQGDYFLLASASKDGYIRLWKITQNVVEAKFHKNVKTLFTSFYVFLESVLISHQCSVTSLHWARFKNLQLASSSLDCTVCIWSKSQQDGTWSVQSRMGQFLGNKNAYFDITSNQTNQYLVAINYIGSAIVWNYSKQEDKFTLHESFNGHSNQAKDIDWNHTGDYLVSVSKDQTTRVLAQHHKDKKYHQISRAQIHGYDINSVALIKVKDNVLDLIACGADEKVIRIVEPPACFANFLNSFTKRNLHLYFNSPQQERKYLLRRDNDKDPLLYETYTEGGTQVLGLMTKVQRVQRQKITTYYEDEEQEQVEQNQKHQQKDIKKVDFNHPPHDDYLVKHTLWPQMNKLYAHPHQIEFLCQSPDYSMLASSCQGLSKQASSIIIWNTQNWKILKVISHHTYTVYSMQFSSSGKYFASVSKDRRLAVFDKNFQLLFGYEPHSRSITSVSFSHDQKYIVTGSRDKSIKIHSLQGQKIIGEHKFQQVVTSVAFCSLQNHLNLICCGFLNGSLILIEFKEDTNEFKIVGQVQQKYAHTQRVNAIKWNKDTFATCSDDFSVKIFKITQFA